jgi:hypothetical protein
MKLVLYNDYFAPMGPALVTADEIGPPLIVTVHDAKQRTWPRGIDQAFANMALGRR